MSHPHEHFTVEGVSRLLNLDHEAVLELIHKGVLPATRLAHGAWSVPAQACMAYLAQKGVYGE